MTVSSRKGELVLATCVDDTHLPLAWIVARSVAWQVRFRRPAVLHVFHSGDDHALAQRLSRFRSLRLRVVVHALASELGHLARADESVPPITYAKLLLPRLLPDETRVLYLDADTLALASVEPLFTLDLKGAPVAAVADTPQGRPPLEIRTRQFQGSVADYYCDVLGIPYDPEHLSYVNAGVMLMDLEALRAERFPERGLDLAAQLADQSIWQDQDVINVLLHGRILQLDPKWNVIPSIFRGECAGSTHVRGLIERQRRAQAIVHFAGGNKPWLRNDVRFGRAWRFFAAMAPEFRAR